MAYNVLRQSIFLVFTLWGFTNVYAQDYFTAALFVHARRGAGTSLSPIEIILTNLNFYIKAASVAKQNNADMIVYPEYGISPATDRKGLASYVEDIPDPKGNPNPCLEASSSTPILQTMSCIARNNSMNVIGNMGDVKNCTEGSQCPQDGKMYYNTNVAFDRNGTLIYKYYEEHLWFERGMNAPTEKQDITFTNDCGYFANFIGFDIQYSNVGPDSVPDSVDAVVYPTTGLTYPPLLIASPWWQAWAIGNNITLLATSLQIPGEQSVGCGIYDGRKGAVVNTYGGEDGISKLIISKVPKRNKQVSPDTVIYAINETSVETWNTDAEHVPARCDMKLLGKPDDVYTQYRCTSQDVSNYTLVKLQEPVGHLKACNNDVCCELDYACDSMKETFYFGVFNGILTVADKYKWWDESCFLARCDDIDGKQCGEFLMQTNTTFTKINMTANFTTNYIYPAIVSSQVKLVPVSDWTYEAKDNQASMNFEKASGIKMIVSGFKARDYAKDPTDTK